MALHGSINDMSRSLGISPARLLASRLDFQRSPSQAASAIAGQARRFDAKQGGRKSVQQIRDAATAFVTTALSQILRPIERVGRERFLFVPGRTGDQAPLLPVIQRAELGKQQLEYQVIGHTGEARWMSSGGVSELRRVNGADDLKSQPLAFFGIRFGWDQFELWNAAHLGRNIETERMNAARQFMDEHLEDALGYGNDEREIPGFFNHGSALTIDLSVSFGAPNITATEIITQLGIIEVAWSRANPKRMISGVVMPKTHRLNMMTIFTGASGEGDINLWKFAKEMFPWLANIVEDDRMLTASDEGASMWTLWSADSEELYAEANASPMLFGPFENELNVDFIAINQTAGVVNKRAERLLRVQFPAVS